MALIVHNLALGLDEPDDLLRARAAEKLRVGTGLIKSLRVARVSLDARIRHMQWIYSVVIELDADEGRALARLRGGDVRPHAPPATPVVQPGDEPMDAPPVIVGAGPAGLFAALLLAEAGYRPVVIDRGREATQRDADVQAFFGERRLDVESNLLFGEGGAGTYSDGKLYTRTHAGLTGWVVKQFIACGADADIAVAGKPHVGSDRLPTVSTNLRKRIESLGGHVRYGCRVDELEIRAGRVRSLQLADGQRQPASSVILAIGHSARDTYRMLAATGVTLSAKPFQLGVRIEHPQSLIDAAQLGPYAGRGDLGPADYHLVARAAAGDRDVYSFCMCPGGRVLTTCNQAQTICSNGGSTAARDSGYANSALVTTISPEQFGDDPLAGVAMQEAIERACFVAGGGDYSLCAQRASDFLGERATDGAVETSSFTGARGCDFNALLDPAIARALHNALPTFDQRIAGFAGGSAVLLGPETRASSPVRIDRDRATRASTSADNLYPVGEGAGFAGGIISSAVDGLRSAETVIARFAPPA